jgi:hypothetical protein
MSQCDMGTVSMTIIARYGDMQSCSGASLRASLADPFTSAPHFHQLPCRMTRMRPSRQPMAQAAASSDSEIPYCATEHTGGAPLNRPLSRMP